MSQEELARPAAVGLGLGLREIEGDCGVGKARTLKISLALVE